ncbi:putative hydrolase [Minicystis rosea]|nr:putative hydrolase [Minicystis rosea]
MKTRIIDLDGPVHVADFGGEGASILLLHGLGASHTSWMAVGDALAKRGRVLAPDLIGFGRTPLAGRAPSIESNVAMLRRLLDRETQGPVTLVGNSMGGLVSVMLASACPDRIARLVLVGPALPRPPGAPVDPQVALLFSLFLLPVFGEMTMRHRLASAGPEKVLRDTLDLCGLRVESLAPEVWQATLTLAQERARLSWATDAYLGAARSLVRVLVQRERVYDAIRRLRAPALLTQGTRDRLVPLVVSEAAARLRSDWKVERMEGVGHVPQLEVPDRWLDLVTRWLPEGS